MNDRTDAVLASIDGALADAELPDAMRWSPEPEAVADASDLPYDGEVVPLPPQRYERGSLPAGSWRAPVVIGEDWLRSLERPVHSGLSPDCAGLAHGDCEGCALCTCHDQRPATWDTEHDYDPAEPIGPRNFPRVTTRRGGIRYPLTPPWVEAQRYPAGDEGSDALSVQHARCRSSVQPVFSDHRPPLAMDLNLPVHAELLAAGRPLRMREALLLRLLTHPEETTEAISQAFQAVIDALRPAVEQFGRGLAEVARQFQGAIPGGPQPTPEPEDVRARALRLRQQRNTGPDRQIQHRHRPRRHQA